MIRTMLLLDGNAEKFWFVARPCATGKQLAAVSDIGTSSPFGDSSAPVHVVPFPAVEHFLTVRTFSGNPLQRTVAASAAKNCGHSAGGLRSTVNMCCYKC